MPRLIKRRAKKLGLQPGSLVHAGEKKIEKTRITLMDYAEIHFEERETRFQAFKEGTEPTMYSPKPDQAKPGEFFELDMDFSGKSG